jgi:hypothetical protein
MWRTAFGLPFGNPRPRGGQRRNLTVAPPEYGVSILGTGIAPALTRHRRERRRLVA